MNKIYLSSGAKLNPVIENIEMFGLSETNNRIEVYLYDCSNTAISDFKHYMMDSPAICFIRSRCQQEDFVNFIESLKSSTFRANFTVNPGNSIGASPDPDSNLVPSSFGYKATYNNKVGFITAAHVVALNDYFSIIYDTNKSNPIGRCLYSSRSGSVDAAFCDLSEGNCTITNNISGNTSQVLSGKCIKHIFYIIILSCISCQYTKKDGVIGYTPKDTLIVPSNVVDEKNCELQVDSVFPVSQRGIPIRIINHTDNVIELGRNDYKLEFYNESSQAWENALPESHAYLMIADAVLPHDTLELTIYEYTGRAGRYRVTKNATVTYGLSRKSHDYILSGEFRLGKEDNGVINDMAIKKSVYDSFRDTFGDYYRTEYDSLPGFLGGIYEADQYNFVIYVVGDLTDGKMLLNRMLGRTDFNVKPALFSYRHLRRMNDSILSFTMREKNKNIRKEIGFLCIWMIVTIYPSLNLKNI